MDISKEKQIIDSWQLNATAWVKAVREKEIESRRLVTDAAIVDVIQHLCAKRILDVGCGEGWLVNELTERGGNAVGFDATKTLIDVAKASRSGEYYWASYDDFIDIIPKPFDLAVCNFSLFGKESVAQLVTQLKQVLTQTGYLVIQTLNPQKTDSEEYSKDGWQPGSWAGFDRAFVQPAPWYFRTQASWQQLLEQSGYELVECLQPAHPDTGVPLSLILVAKPLA